jgi:hypothetical protein
VYTLKSPDKIHLHLQIESRKCTQTRKIPNKPIEKLKKLQKKNREEGIKNQIMEGKNFEN